MANIVSALAKATGKTVAAPFKEAGGAVARQFDPSKAIYGLGLGVGPLLKQTVAEYKRQQGADKERKEEAKAAGIDRKAIKQSSQSSANALGAISKQLSSIATTMKEVRNLSQMQLKMMRAGNVAGQPKPTAGVSISSLKANTEDTGGPLKQGGSDILGSMGGLLDMLGTAGKIGLAGIAGSLLYANRDQIKNTLDEFLKGAGLPTSDAIWKDAKNVIKEKTVEIAKVVGTAITDAVKESATDLGNVVRKQLGLPESGKGSGAGGDLAPRDYATKEMGGSIAGGWLGSKIPGPWWMKMAGGITGGYLGSEYPEEAIGAGAVAFGGKKVWDMRKAAQAKQAAQAAAQAETAAAAAAMRPAPGSFAPPGGYTQAGPSSSILLPESAGRGARTADDMRKMSEAATKQLNMVDKFKVYAGEVTDDIAKMVANPAFKSISQWAGKAAGALGVGVTLSQAYEDIKDGDLAAAGVRISGLLTSLGLATVGSAFLTPAGGVAGGVALSVGSGMLADALKNKERAPISDTLPDVDIMGNATGMPSSSYTPTPVAASKQTFSQASVRAIDNQIMATTSPTATQPSSSGYKIPIEGNVRVVGGFGEPRAGHTHEGVDIPAPVGTPIKAVADGAVFYAGPKGNYGNVVMIKHDDGKMSLYAHMDQISVSPGQRVKAGQVIGTVGNTGSSMGAHLHLEIFDADGKLINPYNVLPGLPRYSGKPVAGVAGADSYDGVGPSSMVKGAPFTGTSAEASAQTQALQNPMDVTKASREHLKRMGFSESEIPKIMEMQAELRDMTSIPKNLEAILLGGEGAGAPSGSIPQQPASAQPQSGGNATPPSAAAISDFEKDRLMRMNQNRAHWPAWAQ